MTDNKPGTPIFTARRLLLAVFALALSALAGCGGNDPAAQLKREIGAMQAAVEAHKPGDFLRYVGEDFSAQDGQVDKRTLHGLLVSQLLGDEHVVVTLGPLDIHLHDADHATVKVSALLVGGRLLPEHGQTLEIESGWKRSGGEWHCYVANWKEGL
jgi:hypothetical protein